jgi:PIN domain nuclease of toxin-antitoxin system
MILLDTHVLLWLATDPRRLSRQAGSAIRRASRDGGVGISAISFWELAWLAMNGRIEFTGTLEAFVEKTTARVAVRPLSARIAVLANQLPVDYPHDPCDRLIGATALAEGIALITKDARIRACRQIHTIW